MRKQKLQKSLYKKELLTLATIFNIFLVTFAIIFAVNYFKQKNNASTISPLLYGTNLVLNDSSDPIFNTADQNALLQIHTQFIRMPIRSNSGDSAELAAMKVLNNMGVTPEVIVHGAVDSNVLSDDKQLIKDALSAFGNKTVYIDFGNEEEDAGISESQYVSSWDSVIPALKQMAPNYQFGGPVAAWNNASYLANFLHDVKTKPDFIVWHRYSCNSGDSLSSCLGKVDDVINDVKSVRSALASSSGSLGQNIHLVLDEWNYKTTYCSNDSGCSDTSFMTQYTEKEIQDLATAGVWASAQYEQGVMVTSGGGLNPQGAGFKQSYEQLIGTTTPPPTTVPPTPTQTPPPTNTQTPVPTKPRPTNTIVPTTKMPSQTSAASISPTNTPTSTIPVTTSMTPSTSGIQTNLLGAPTSTATPIIDANKAHSNAGLIIILSCIACIIVFVWTFLLYRRLKNPSAAKVPSAPDRIKTQERVGRIKM